MITSQWFPFAMKPLLTFFLVIIAVSQTSAKKAIVLRRWESTGIVNCTTENTFTCEDDKYMLLPIHQRCDGIAHCGDHSDERNCTECLTPFSVTNADGTLECLTSDGLRSEKFARDYEEGRKERILSQPLWFRKLYHPEFKSDDSMYQKCAEPSQQELMWRNWTSGCEPNEIRCSHEQMCVPASSMCDGVEDCPRSANYWYDKKGGEDESGCTECKNGAVMCAVGRKCIAKASICDGYKDCIDGSDEQNCTCATCGANRALCGNGKCIRQSQVCDGRINCEDASDEQNCPTACGAMITNTTKLPEIVSREKKRYLKSEMCVGASPSIYGEDCTREECDCRTAFYCDGKCLSKDKVCDGKRDCWNGEDEKNCLKACAKYPHFSCVNKLVLKCLTIDHRCDGIRDCADGSDEKKCDKCPADAHRCDGGCIPAAKRCDGVKDCKDGSDEKNCSCEDCTKVRLDTYSCEASGTCMKRAAACGPHSLCPNPTARDELFCVRQSRRKGPKGTKNSEDTSRFWD